MKRAAGCASALTLALVFSACYADDTASPSNAQTNTNNAQTNTHNTQTTPSMSGKEKATAIGVGGGAVAGAVVGGPIGAVVGAGLGGLVGHDGTDANGRIRDHNRTSSMSQGDDTVRKAQAALNDQGFDAGAVDGRAGPNTESAVRRFQSKNGLSETGTLDSSTRSALGVN